MTRRWKKYDRYHSLKARLRGSCDWRLSDVYRQFKLLVSLDSIITQWLCIVISIWAEMKVEEGQFGDGSSLSWQWAEPEALRQWEPKMMVCFPLVFLGPQHRAGRLNSWGKWPAERWSTGCAVPFSCTSRRAANFCGGVRPAFVSKPRQSVNVILIVS